MTPATLPFSPPVVPQEHRREGWAELEQALLQCTQIERALLDLEAEQAGASIAKRLELAEEQRKLESRLEWIEGILPALSDKVRQEQWLSMRNALNREWAPTAEQRIVAAQDVQDAVDVLVGALRGYLAVHEAQRQILSRYSGMDRVVVGLTPLNPVVHIHQGSSEAIMAWTKGRLQQFSPTDKVDHAARYVQHPRCVGYQNKVI